MRKPAKQQRSRPGLECSVASRMLVGEPPSRRHEVRIGRPEPDRAGDWRCAYHIRGIGMRSPRYAFGVDAVQALILAIEGIRHDLSTAGIALRWAEGERDDPGFPRYVPTAFGVGLARRIDRLIDRELSRHCKNLAAKAQRRKKRRAA